MCAWPRFLSVCINCPNFLLYEIGSERAKIIVRRTILCDEEHELVKLEAVEQSSVRNSRPNMTREAVSGGTGETGACT